jgi:hypothetical protein
MKSCCLFIPTPVVSESDNSPINRATSLRLELFDEAGSEVVDELELGFDGLESEVFDELEFEASDELGSVLIVVVKRSGGHLRWDE